MKRAYHDLMEQISVPSGLNDRVLQAVRQEAAGVGTRWKRTALRAAVCAACALALVLGQIPAHLQAQAFGHCPHRSRS